MERFVQSPVRSSSTRPSSQNVVTSQPNPATGLLSTIESAFLSGAYSDLIIQCHGRVFKAHKLIVCGQSEWFARACQKDGFKEGDSGVVDLPFDDPAVVKAMLQYLYTFDYTVPDDLEETIAYAQARAMQQKSPVTSHHGPQEAEADADASRADDDTVEQTEQDEDENVDPHGYGANRDLTGNHVEPNALGIGTQRPQSHADYLWRMYHRSLIPRNEGGNAEPTDEEAEGEASTPKPLPEPEYDERALPPMLFHINVYALADRVQNKPLKTMAENKFEVLAKKEWKSPDFPSAIEAIYSVAPPGSHGDSLRKMIVRLVVSHAKELFSLDRGFTNMLQETPDFAADLARALSGAGISAKGAEANVDVEELCCPGCKFTMKAAIAKDINMLTCPVCKWEGIVSRWRHGMKDQGVLKKGRRSVLTNSWEL